MNRFGHANCIDCGKPHGRWHNAWRCFTCAADYTAVQFAAYRELNKARKTGSILPAAWLNCVDCGGRACDYDHRDYRRPLDVEPVCRACNQKRPPALWRDPVDSGHRLLEVV